MFTAQFTDSRAIEQSYYARDLFLYTIPLTRFILEQTLFYSNRICTKKNYNTSDGNKDTYDTYKIVNQQEKKCAKLDASDWAQNTSDGTLSPH